tara:strand:- start:400 stop:624 length:225 start_codon:yes stop_codon:yes gene_type:complete
MWNNQNYNQQPSLAQQRMMICRACPFSRETTGVGLTCGKLLRPEYDQYGNQLTCGCILKAKTALKNQRCPQNKW